MDREKLITHFEHFLNAAKGNYQDFVDLTVDVGEEILALLKEQEGFLKHEYWRGYNNGRTDERGLQEGTIMQTFSPD